MNTTETKSSRMGIIGNVDNKNKTVEIDFGDYLGEHILPPEEVEKLGFIDMEITASKVRLDNGSEVFTSNSTYFAEEESIRVMMADYEKKGYRIIHK